MTEEHKKRLDILEKKMGTGYYLTGEYHNDISDAMESYKDHCVNAISVNLENNDEKEAYLIGFAHGKKLIENRVKAISDKEIVRILEKHSWNYNGDLNVEQDEFYKIANEIKNKLLKK